MRREKTVQNHVGFQKKLLFRNICMCSLQDETQAEYKAVPTSTKHEDLLDLLETAKDSLGQFEIKSRDENR